MIGGVITGQRSAYTYLPHSALKFPQPPELAEIMRAAGLRDVHYRLAMPVSAHRHGGRSLGDKMSGREPNG